MIKYFFAFIMIIAFNTNLYSQTPNGYTYALSLNTQMKRKIPANEIMVDDSSNYIIINYGNKPTYILIYTIGTWEVVGSFRLRNWVEFSGAYYDAESKQFFIQEARYSSKYYSLNLETKEIDILECEQTPRQCPTIEPRQGDLSISTFDNSYKIIIDKKNRRDVKVYNKD